MHSPESAQSSPEPAWLPWSCAASACHGADEPLANLALGAGGCRFAGAGVWGCAAPPAADRRTKSAGCIRGWSRWSCSGTTPRATSSTPHARAVLVRALAHGGRSDAGRRAHRPPGDGVAELSRRRPLAGCAGNRGAGARARRRDRMDACICRTRITRGSNPSAASARRASSGLQDRFGQPAAISTEKKFGGGKGGAHMSDGFLGRWSRRKNDGARGQAGGGAASAAGRPSPLLSPLLPRRRTQASASWTSAPRLAPGARRPPPLTLEDVRSPWTRRPTSSPSWRSGVTHGCAQRRRQEAVCRSALQRDGPARHLHRRLQPARSAARRHAAPDGQRQAS
jgi:hypothetical protein